LGRGNAVSAAPRLRLAAVLVALVSLAATPPLCAQQAPATSADLQAPLPPLPISPRGAMIRAMLVPGWGHAAIGSYTRGGFYFALESLTAYTFLRTRARLTDVRERAAFRETFVRATLAAGGVTDPAAIEAGLAEDGVLQGLEDLASSRENQQEDLVAFGIFVIFLTGADAFVSAHLARFPDPIDVQVAPTAAGGAEVSVRVPLPR
jgi:hypothetical protein